MDDKDKQLIVLAERFDNRPLNVLRIGVVEKAVRLLRPLRNSNDPNARSLRENCSHPARRSSRTKAQRLVTKLGRVGHYGPAKLGELCARHCARFSGDPNLAPTLAAAVTIGACREICKLRSPNKVVYRQ